MLSSLLSSAQDGSNVFPFLNIPVSARQAALGGDVISIRDYDPNFAGINPSLLNIEHHNQLAANAALYIADSKFATLSYARDLGEGHLVNFMARALDYGKMPRMDEYGFQNGEFGALDASIGLGYAYQFEDEWTVGGNLNFVSARIDNYSSMAVSGTAAVAYHRKKRKETATLVFRNFGYQFKTFNGTCEVMPLRVDLGYTRILNKVPIAVSVTAHDLQKFNISSEYNINGQEVNFGRKILDHLSFGIEFFPERNFNLRLGYNAKRGNELAVLDQRNFSGISGGFGFRMSTFRFDYAHIRYHNAANVNMIGISIDLDGKRY